MDSAENARRLVSVKEACRYGRFGVTKCYDLINEGRIKAYKFDTRTLIDLNSVDAMLAALPALDADTKTRAPRRTGKRGKRRSSVDRHAARGKLDGIADA